MGHQTILQTPSPGGSTPSQSFGWSDFPLLGQSLISEEEIRLATSKTGGKSQKQGQKCTSQTSSSRPSSPARRIKFTSVEIREYALVVGDHPMCGDGLPLSLDWKYNAESTILPVDDVERAKSSASSWYVWSETPCRKLSFLERKNRLKQVSGLTEVQLRRAERERTRLLQKEWLFAKQQEAKNMDIKMDVMDAPPPPLSNTGGLHHVSQCMNLSEAMVAS